MTNEENNEKTKANLYSFLYAQLNRFSVCDQRDYLQMLDKFPKIDKCSPDFIVGWISAMTPIDKKYDFVDNFNNAGFGSLITCHQSSDSEFLKGSYQGMYALDLFNDDSCDCDGECNCHDEEKEKFDLTEYYDGILADFEESQKEKWDEYCDRWNQYDFSPDDDSNWDNSYDDSDSNSN